MSEQAATPTVGVTKATVQTGVSTVKAGVSPVAAPGGTVGGLTGAVNKAGGQTALPKGIQKHNTKELSTGGYMHAVVYAETSARKSSTAARFGTPENVRIILTRRPEQLIPLTPNSKDDAGYEFITVTDADALMYALQYPERIWPEWAGREDRVLILDDITEAVNQLLDENKEIDGKEVRDARRTYRATGDDLRVVIQSVLNKSMHFIVVATAKVKNNPITNEDTVGPDLPPSMLNLILTEFEFVLYIKPSTWKFLTDRDSVTVEVVDKETGKKSSYTKKIFAKHKLPLGMVGKGVIKKDEELDLRALWEKRQKGLGVK